MKLRERMTVRSMLALTLLLLVIVPIHDARAANNFATSEIADEAETHPDGSHGGQCKAFVANMVWAVSGHTVNPTGYQQGFADAGGVEVTDPAQAQRGISSR